MEELMRTWMSFAVTALALFTLSVGCHNSEGGGPVNAPVVTAPPKPEPVLSTDSTRLAMGSLPLQHMVASGGILRVMDVTNNKQLFKDDVPPNSLVRIDETTGIHIGSKNPVSKKLNNGHRYEIWLDRR